MAQCAAPHCCPSSRDSRLLLNHVLRPRQASLSTSGPTLFSTWRERWVDWGSGRCIHPGSVKVTIFGKSAFADVIEDPEKGSSGITWVDPKSHGKCP